MSLACDKLGSILLIFYALMPPETSPVLAVVKLCFFNLISCKCNKMFKYQLCSNNSNLIRNLNFIL